MSDTESPEEPPRRSQLSAEQKKQVADWFEKKAKKHDPKCPICGTGNWAVLDDFVMPTNYNQGGPLTLGGTISYPHFMLLCTNCGNVQFINAVGAGVLPGAASK